MLRLAIALLLASTSTGLADDLPPGVVDTQHPGDASLSPQESLSRITVPDGFHVTLFAGEPDVRRPIAFDFDDRGRLWVCENYSHPEWQANRKNDRILILEDTDHDGQFDLRKVFWDKGHYLTGIAVGHGGVWIANAPELAFIPDRDGDDVPDSDPVVMLDGFHQSENNVLNNFHWGPDGWLYGAIGLSTPSLVGKPSAPDAERVQITRGIWRFHPVSQEFEVVAQGMVNPWGADFNELGDLFTTNTVIAHLWHIVPGMYCQRRDREHDNPYVYRRIQSIANHLHWGGDPWQSSRKPNERNSVAGGGHAHCGAMIYLGDNWPTEYRGSFFTVNMHGNRINCDQLLPNRSTYVGVHANDFLFGNDPWFRGLSVKYGPDGGVYLSDWHDFGECHDSDGSHRSSGRVYKVVYGVPAKQTISLNRQSSIELAALHYHPNEWFVRHARRILHERAAAECDLSSASQRLREIFENNDDEVLKLRALWTLYIIDSLNEVALTQLLSHESEHVRRWSVKLLVDRGSPGSEAIAAMNIMAASDNSPKVRLALAAALSRLPFEHRWSIAGALMSHAEDAADPYLPLMIWYGSEPILSTDAPAALELASASRIPLLRRFIARRLLDGDLSHIEEVAAAALAARDQSARHDVLLGMLEALEGSGPHSPPDCWSELYSQVRADSDPALRWTAVRLASLFGDESAISRLRELVFDENTPARRRRESFLALLKDNESVPISMLHELSTGASLFRRDAIQALTLRNNAATSGVLLNAYPDLSPRERQDAIGVLVTRRDFAVKLLDSIVSGHVNRDDVSAFALQQLREFKVEPIKERVDALWADDAEQLSKSSEIARYRQKLTPDYLALGSAAAGRRVFDRRCSNCHALFGEGGNIGPDLTGSGRKNFDYVLSNLIDPSANIDPAYQLTTILTNDGKMLIGFIVHQGDEFVTIRTEQAQIRISIKEVEELKTSRKSMMPDGLLHSFTDEEVRDLILYLASPRQLAPKHPGGEQ